MLTTSGAKESMSLRHKGSWKNNADYCEPKLKRRYSVLRLLQSLRNSMLHQWRRPRLRNVKLYDANVSPQKPRVLQPQRLRPFTGHRQRLREQEPKQRKKNAGSSLRLLRRLRGEH